MKVQVSQSFFDVVKNQFLNLNLENVDPEIASTLELFRNSPVLDKVVPRWSCQGHSYESRDNSFYIIFVTVDDGDQFLLDFTGRVTEKMVERYGIGMMAGTSMSIVNLIHQDFDDMFKHIQVETYNNGSLDLIDSTKSIWKEVLEELTKESYEL